MSRIITEKGTQTRFKPYSAYKDSGVEWLGEIPAHWEVKKWRYSCHVTEGQVAPDDDRYCDRVMIAPNHIESGSGRILFTETADEQGAISGKYLVSAGDIIYSKIRPALNKACIATGEWLCSADMYPVKVTANNLRSKFLLYFMLSEPFVRLMVDESMRVAMPKVNRDELAACPLPMPPQAEQEAIAALLDRETARIDALVAKKERLIELLQEKGTSLIETVVRGEPGSRETRLGYYVDLLPGYAFPSEQFSHDADDVRLLRGVNVSPDGVRWDDAAVWPVAEATRFTDYQLRQGDLVFGMDRPWVSAGIRVAEVTDADVPSLLLQRVARLRARAGLSQKYLKLILSSPQFRAYFEPILTGISVPHVSPEQILSFRLRLPTFDVQEAACQRARVQLVPLLSMRDVLKKSNRPTQGTQGPPSSPPR